MPAAAGDSAGRRRFSGISEVAEAIPALLVARDRLVRSRSGSGSIESAAFKADRALHRRTGIPFSENEVEWTLRAS